MQDTRVVCGMSLALAGRSLVDPGLSFLASKRVTAYKAGVLLKGRFPLTLA